MRLGLVLLASLLLLPSAAQAQWTAPQTVAVSPKQGCACLQKLALDAKGRGVVAWERKGASDAYSAVVLSRDIRADGSLSAPVQVSPKGVRAYGSRLAVADDGQAAIVFATGGRAGVYPKKRENRTVQVVTRAPGGRWSAPRVLSTGGRNFPNAVVIEPSGRVVVAWTHARDRERRDRVRRVELRRVSSDGRRSLSFTRLPYGTLSAALAASPAFPRAALAYQIEPPEAGPRTLRLRVGNRDWRLDDRQNREAVALAADERLTVAWGHYSLDHEPDYDYQLVTADLAPGDAKPAITVLDEAGGPLGSPSLGAEGDRAVLSWFRYPTLEPGGEPDFGFTARFAQAQDGVFGTPVDLNEDGGGPAARIGGGRVVTAWVGPGTKPRTDENGQLIIERLTAPLVAAVGDAGGPLGPPTTLVADENPDFFKLAVSADGSAVIVYRTTNLLDEAGRDFTLRMVRLPR